jgi:hypothetical protein
MRFWRIRNDDVRHVVQAKPVFGKAVSLIVFEKT